MSTVKDFLFKYKIIIGVVVFLLLSFGIYMFVSAESDEYENQIEVINTTVTTKDGTAPFDSDDNPGNDSNESNGIVRNFDAITYAIKGKLAYKQSSTLPEDKKTSGIQRSIVIDVLLPESVNARVATGDLSNPIGGTSTKVTINGVNYNYYKFTEPGKELIDSIDIANVLIYDINMKNGSDIQPIIRVREATDKSFSDYSDSTDLSNSGSMSGVTSIKVSGKDSWAAKLYPGSSSHKNGRDNPTVSLGVVLYIPSDNNKGIKGAQIPDNISLDLNVIANPTGISTVDGYTISDYKSGDSIENMPSAYSQNNGTSSATKTDNGCTITYTGLSYHDDTINIGTTDNPKNVKYISSKTLTVNTSRTGSSKENITYNFGIAGNGISDASGNANIIDSYVPVVGNYQSKVDFRNSTIDTELVEANSAVYNYGEDFVIENTINYGSRIGDTLSGFTNYLKIDSDAIKIIDISEGSGKDYTIKFDGETTGLKENTDYNVKYVVGEWNLNYFGLKSGAPTYCSVSSLTGDELKNRLMNYYGGPCIEANSSVKEYSTLNEIPEESLDKIIAVKLNVTSDYKEKSTITMDFKAKVKPNINLSGKTYQITSRGVTNFNGTEFYMSNPLQGLPVNVANQSQDISYTKMGYNGSVITGSTNNTQDGNSILVTTAKGKIEKIDVADKYDVSDKTIYAGQNDPVTITINPIVYSSQVGINASKVNLDVYLPKTLTLDVQSGDKTYSSVREEAMDGVGYYVYTYTYTEDDIKSDGESTAGTVPALKLHANVSVDTKDNSNSVIYARVYGKVKINGTEYDINNPEATRIASKDISIRNTNVIGLLGVTNPTYIDANGSFTYNMKATNLSDSNANVELLYILPFDGDSLGEESGSKYNGTISTAIDGTLPTGYKVYYTKDSAKTILNNEIGSGNVNWAEWKSYNTAASGITAIKIVSTSEIASGAYFAGNSGINLKFTTKGNKEADIYYNNFYALHKNGQVCSDDDCKTTSTGLNVYSSNVTSSSVYNRTISGFAFVDADYDGFSTDTDDRVKDIAVDLYRTTAKIEDSKKPLTVISDTDEKVAETTTDSNGRYSFSGLKSGNYYVKYTFDCDKYTTTEKNKVDNTKGDTSTIDSDAEMMSGTCAAVSNIITLDNNRINSSNIDLGLRVRQVFDVSVNKYITNVTVTSNKGVESHDYDRKKQVRLDLKNLKNTSFKVVYTIELENTKYFPGTVGNIIESIPDGMTFDPNLAENDGWYENDGLLYYSNLDSTLLMPGEKYYITIALNLVTDSGGSYVNFVSVNDLQVQSVVSDLTDVKDENDFSSDTEDNSDIDSDTGNTGEGE